MDLRQLRYFVAIVEAGSLSRAAAALRVAQPALSQHLRNMEEELGVAILHRTNRGVQPTPAGTRLLRLARTVMAEFATMRDVVRGDETSPAGEVRIGLPGTVSELLGVPLIEAVRARLPSVHLRVREAMSGFVLDWLDRGELDLAVAHGIGGRRGLQSEHILSEALCLFGAPALRAAVPSGTDTVALRDVAALPLILPSPSQGLRAAIDAGAVGAGVTLAPEIEVDSYAQLKLLAMRGLGFGLLPEAVVRRQVEGGQLASWRLDPPIRRDIVLAWASARPLSAAARATAGVLLDVVDGLVRGGAWPALLCRGDAFAPPDNG